MKIKEVFERKQFSDEEEAAVNLKNSQRDCESGLYIDSEVGYERVVK